MPRSVDPVPLEDFHATLMYLLGFEHKKLTYPFQGIRPAPYRCQQCQSDQRVDRLKLYSLLNTDDLLNRLGEQSAVRVSDIAPGKGIARMDPGRLHDYQSTFI